MGSTSSFHSLQSNDASIELDNEHLYYPGEVVSGTLHLKHKNALIEPISIDLIGEIGFIVGFYSVCAQSASSYDDHIPFFKVSTLSITDGEKFSLCLNEELPPTVNLGVGTYPYIQYFFQVNLSKTKQHRHYIIVCPRVSIPRSIIQSQQFNASNHKEIFLSGSVDRDWVLPGQTLQINIKITNPHHKYIKYIHGNIFMKSEFTKKEYTEKVLDFIVNNVVDTNKEYITDDISLTIPSRYLPPTFTYTNDQYQFDININYWIVIEMHVRGLFNSVSTTIPLSIGFERENITFDEQYKPDRQHTNDISLKHHRRHNSS